MCSQATGYAVKVSIAAHHYNDLRIQVGSEAALCHTLQRFDVRREDVLREACHYGCLPDAHEVPGTVAW